VSKLIDLVDADLKSIGFEPRTHHARTTHPRTQPARAPALGFPTLHTWLGLAAGVGR
jgi:hypothetical protein